MVASIDVAYLVSMTSFDGEVSRIDLYYDGSHPMKGVMGGAPYPVFWINMSSESSLAVKEDKLKLQMSANREDLKEYCDAFYQEFSSFVFRPFINNDIGQTMAKAPSWYDDYHKSLVKNFNLPDNEYSQEPLETVADEPSFNQSDLEDVIDQIDLTPLMRDCKFQTGDIVAHPKFGSGKITSIDKNKVTVSFESGGEKRILDEFLSLVSK